MTALLEVSDTLYQHHMVDMVPHEELARVLREHSDRLQFLLTHTDSEAYRSLYDWATLTEWSWKYTNAGAGKRMRLAHELIVTNAEIEHQARLL